MNNKEETSRRNFLSMIFSAIAGLIGLAVGIPAIAYVISPTLKKEQKENWLRMGAVGKASSKVPTLLKTRVVRKTGWTSKEDEVAAYVFTGDDGNLTALSNVCTHLGCSVRWVEDKAGFFCPCHNAYFGKDGGVVSGPPPRPLDKYKVKVENDQIYIQTGG